MPRKARLGRKPKKCRAALAPVDENLPVSSEVDEEGDADMDPPPDCADCSSAEHDADDGDAEMLAATEPNLDPMVDAMRAVREQEVGWIPGLGSNQEGRIAPQVDFLRC